MSSTQVTIQDRRGFEPVLVLGVVLIVAGIVVGVLEQSSAWGSAMFVVMGFTIFSTALRISQPPRNDPFHFVECQKTRKATKIKKRPVLVCIGDSLTHGTCSANVVNAINPTLHQRLHHNNDAVSLRQDDFSFQHPLYVVNAGQNNICSWTVLHEKIDSILEGCRPDYVLLWIGTNDLRSIYKASWGRQMVTMWNLPQVPTMEELLRNVTALLNRIQQQHDRIKIGICTLPPMGEDASNAPANRLVKQANAMIEKLAASESYKKNCTIIPVYKSLERHILSTQAEGEGTKKVPVDYFLLLGSVMSMLYYIFGVAWQSSSSWIGNVVLSDSLHLNEIGGDIVASEIVEWLLRIGVKEAMDDKKK